MGFEGSLTPASCAAEVRVSRERRVLIRAL